MIRGRMVLKLSRRRKNVAGDENKGSREDLNKHLKPCPKKARTPRVETWPQQPPTVSSAEASVHPDENNDGGPQVSSGSGASAGHVGSEKVIGFADNSRNLKRKSDGSGRKIQKITQATKSTSSRTGAEIQIAQASVHPDENNDDGPQVSSGSGASTGHVGSEKVIGFADNSGNLKRKSDDRSGRKIQKITQGTKTSSSSTGAEFQIAPETPKKYACSFCDKVYSSHEALGGHKSSHKKFKMVITNAEEERIKKRLATTNTCPQVQTASATPEPPLLGDDGTQHTCKICFKKFPSGQALGGHQRCHWAANMPHGNTSKILDFDLNELPN